MCLHGECVHVCACMCACMVNVCMCGEGTENSNHTTKAGNKGLRVTGQLTNSEGLTMSCVYIRCFNGKNVLEWGGVMGTREHGYGNRNKQDCSSCEN